MPALRSSTNGGACKVRRKPRVTLGNLKASSDGKARFARSSSNADKAHIKARVARDGDRTMGSKMYIRGIKMKSEGNENGSTSHVDLKETSNEKRVWKKRDVRKGSQGFETISDMILGQKRKRTSADTGVVGDTMLNGIHKKSFSKSKSSVSELHFDMGGKNVPRGNLLMRWSKFKGHRMLQKKIRVDNAEGGDKQKPVRENGLGNRTLTTTDKRKISRGTTKDLSQRSHDGGPVEKPRKKNDRVKESLVNRSDLMDAPQPMKKKRVIRIDPHDTSNKRLDDGIANNSNIIAKTDLEENNDSERSKNAQFRAIRPSPSILSFVEDNLLGRRRDIEFRRAGYNTHLSAPLDNIPSSTSSERERIEVSVFRNKLEFFAAAKMSLSFPSPDLPEIAFAGRSNVGKSSLLNALTRQWGVVRTSDKPGLTQSINFFKLGPKLSLVDLPGYGFAYAKEEVKEAWQELVKEYVTTRVGLKRVCILVDTKWGMKPRDLELIDLMERFQTKYQVVLTKTDLVFPIDVARRAMQIEENLKAKKSAVQPLMMVSSKTGAGIRCLRTVLANVARLVR